MNHRIVGFLLALISVGLIGVGYLLLGYPSLIGLCPDTTPNCLSEAWWYGVGLPLSQGIYFLPILFIAVALVSREVFSVWWKVMLPVGIVFLIIVFVTPPTPENITAGRADVTAALTKIFVFVSAIVIAWKYWRLRVQK